MRYAILVTVAGFAVALASVLGATRCGFHW